MIIRHILESETNYSLVAELFRVFPAARNELIHEFMKDVRTDLSERLGPNFIVTCGVEQSGPTLQVRGVDWRSGIKIALVPDGKHATWYYVGLHVDSEHPSLNEIRAALYERTGILEEPKNSWYWWQYLEKELWESEKSPALAMIATSEYKSQVTGLIEHVVRIVDPFLKTSKRSEYASS